MKKSLLLLLMVAFSFGVSAQYDMGPKKQRENLVPKNKKEDTRELQRKSEEAPSFYMPNLYNCNPNNNGESKGLFGAMFFPDTMAAVNVLYQGKAGDGATLDSINRGWYSNPLYGATSIAVTFDPYSTIFMNGVAGLVSDNKGYSIDSIIVPFTYRRHYKGADADDIMDTLRVTIGAYQAYPLIDAEGQPSELNYDPTGGTTIGYVSQGIVWNCAKIDVNTQPTGIGSVWTYNPENTELKYTYDILLEAADTCETESGINWVNIGPKVEIDKVLQTVQPGFITVVKLDYVPGHDYENGILDTADTRTEIADNDGEVVLEAPNVNLLQYIFRYAPEADSDPSKGFYDMYGYNAASYVDIWSRLASENVIELQKKYTWPCAAAADIMPGFTFYYTENRNGDGSYIDRGSSAINEVSSVINTVYPNPAKDALNVTLKNEGAAEISLVNMLGQTVKTVSTDKLMNTINVSDVKAGMYILRVAQGNQMSTAKISIR